MTPQLETAPRSPRALRRRQPYNDALPSTVRWIARLPGEVQPLDLLRRYPRIANQLARSCGHAGDFQQAIDDLVTDTRGGRQGFPVAVTEELLVLRDFYQGRYAQLPGVGGAAAEPGKRRAA